MRSFMQTLFAAALGVIIGSAGVSNAAISLLTGPQDPSQLLRLFNSLITDVNTNVTTYLTMGTSGELGELAFSKAATFAANETVATSLTSVGPVGSHTTVQKWLTVVDQSGNILYAPLF